MATRTWHLFRKGDGRFTQSVSLQDYVGVENHIAATTPEDYGAFEYAGTIDYESQRFDPERGLVNFQPPAPEPADQYQWDEFTRRWQIRPEVAERQANVTTAQAEIDRLESVQLRAIREAYLDPADDEARKRVTDIDSAIAAQRAIIRANS